MFGIELWNQWARSEEYMRRTNNNVEGWHRALTSTIGISNPTIRKFFEELKKRIQYQAREIGGSEEEIRAHRGGRHGRI